MRILVVDKFEAWGIDQLKALATEVRNEPGLKGEPLKQLVASYDPQLIVVRSTKITADIINAGTHMRGIIRAGSGYDNIDLAAASAHGVMVSNCPGMNACAVGELAMGLIIALDRRIPDNVTDFRNRRWKKKEFSKTARGLNGRTIGIIGAGKIGTLVARAAMGFGMRVLYYNLGRSQRLMDYPQCRRTEIDELLRESDFVTIHVPGDDSTHHLVDEARLAMMKKEAVLVNTSRAGVVDEAALARALREGRLRGAALDVFPGEPAADAETVESPLAEVPNLYVTHHIGASTEEAQMAVATETVRLVREFKTTGKLPNCVNMQTDPRHECLLVVRMRNRPGTLAYIFNVIGDADINAEEMDHVIYDGGNAAAAHIRIDKHPADATLKKLREGNPNIIAAEVLNA